MKKFIVANLIVLTAFAVKAGREFSNKNELEFEKTINSQAKQAVTITNLKSELAFQKKALEHYKSQFDKMTNTNQQLLSANQQARNFIQKLKVDNDNLVKTLENKDLITPEIAKQIKRYDGRIPASFNGSKK